MSSDLERRDAVLELRSEGTKITGYAVVFDVRSRDMGGFVEVVRPDAVSETGDVVCLFNHNADNVLGRTPATLQLRKDTRGLAFTLDPAPTQAGKDALELVRRRDIQGASFGFVTKRDAWRQDAGVTVRELLDVELREISLTAFPCYVETDVTVARRSLQAFHAETPSRVSRRQWLERQHRVRALVTR